MSRESVCGHNLLSCRTAGSFRERYRSESNETLYKKTRIYAPNRTVIEVFAWVATMLAFSGMGSWIGSHGINTIVNMTVGARFTTLTAYVILPAVTMSTLLKYERSCFNDVTIRFMLLTSAAIQGVLIGSVQDPKCLQNEPIAFITPVVFALVYAKVAESVRGLVSPVQTACAGTALFANYLMGLLTGKLSNTYEVMTLAYVAVNVAVMQLMMRADSNPWLLSGLCRGWSTRLRGISSNTQKRYGHICQYLLLESLVFVNALFYITSSY